MTLSLFFQSRYFSVAAPQVDYDAYEDGDEYGNTNVNFSIAPHFIGHALGKQCIIANKQKAGKYNSFDHL